VGGLQGGRPERSYRRATKYLEKSLPLQSIVKVCNSYNIGPLPNKKEKTEFCLEPYTTKTCYCPHVSVKILYVKPPSLE